LDVFAENGMERWNRFEIRAMKVYFLLRKGFGVVEDKRLAEICLLLLKRMRWILTEL